MIDQKTYFNPFPGLRSFEENEEYLFFGREKQIDDLLDQLEKTHFLAVIGTSGSGKSSLVKSGLLPSLHSGFIRGVGKGWRIGVFRPGDNPIGNLASCLSSGELVAEENEEENFNLQPIIESVLRRSDQGILNVVNQFLNKFPENILLVADQFEELFRFSRYERTSSKGTRDAVLFVNLLLTAIGDRKRRIYVVFTMRSDFIGNCTEFRGLPEAMNTGQYLIPRMSRNEIQLAITGPIAVSGAEISSQLLSMLLNEVGDNPDQLPILQHALMRTYDYWSEHTNREAPITIEHYQSIGKMELALSYHADEAYYELTEEQKIICAAIFRLLTETGTVAGGVRRPTNLLELCKLLAVDKDTLIPIINVFRQYGRSFLMPSLEIELHDESVIDISHESLMRVWVRLIDWFKEEMNSTEIYLKLCKDAASYQDGKGSLLINPELAIMLKWREKQRPTEGWGARYNTSYLRAINFLEDSKRKFDQSVVFKNLEQAKRIKRNKIFTYFVAITSVICLFLATYSWLEKQKADEAKKTAVQKGEETDKARKEAEKSADDAKEARDSMEAEKSAADKARKGAEKSAADAKEARDSMEAEKSAADKARKGAEKSAADAKEARDSMEVAKNHAVQSKNATKKAKEDTERLKNVSDAINKAFEAEKKLDSDQLNDGILLAMDAYELFSKNTNDSKRNTQIYKALDKALQKGKGYKSNFYKHSLGILKILKSSNSHELLILDEGKRITVLKEVASGLEEVTKLDFENVSDMIFSNDAKLLIASNTSGKIHFYNTEDYSNQNEESFPNASISSIQTFAVSGVEYLMVSGDKSRLINLSTREKINIPELDKLESSKNTISTKGDYLASYQKGGLFLYSFKIESSQLVLKALDRIDTTTDEVTTLKFLESNLIATGSDKGVVKIYKISDDKAMSLVSNIENHKNVKISGIDMYKDSFESLIITSSFDNTLNVSKLFNPKDNISINAHKSWIRDIFFDKSQKKIYSVSQDTYVKYWYIDPEDIFKLLKN
jgi:WD40 repeat protein/energy-coupling factor transporter ATP-binding protein EcfA2